jgi:hypothetical protein
MEDHSRWGRKSGDFLAKNGRATAAPQFSTALESGGKYLVSGMLLFLAQWLHPRSPI